MNILDKYSAIHNYALHEASVPVYTPPERTEVKILTDIKPITVAEISPVSRDLITAHRLKDYRRKTFSLLLLPDIELLIDSFFTELPPLQEVKGFGAYD